MNLKSLLQLEWKYILRNRSALWELELAFKVIFGGAGLVVFLSLGLMVWLLPSILDKSGYDTMTTISQYLHYYILIDIVLRWVFQDLPTSSITQYLHTPIKKNMLANYLIIKLLLNFFNFLALFCGVLFSLSFFGLTLKGGLWFLSLFAWIIIDNFFVCFCKLHLGQSLKTIFGIVFSLAFLYLLNYF